MNSKGLSSFIIICMSELMASATFIYMGTQEHDRFIKQMIYKNIIIYLYVMLID
jgi:hypothetical protein